MSVHLDGLILAAVDAQIRETGSTNPMDVVDDVFKSIAPADYASTLRLIISQRVEVGTPSRSTP